MTAEQAQGVAVVTGASRGIGAAIAEKLAGDGYGVIVNYAAGAARAESVAAAIRADGGRAAAVRADVAERATSPTCSIGPNTRWARWPGWSTTPGSWESGCASTSRKRTSCRG